MIMHHLFTLLNLAIVASLFGAMVAVQELGRRSGERDRVAHGRDRTKPSATEGAVYGLLGLFLAFTFSGAGSRYESRRRLVVDEANAIGTAWLRLDVLPSPAQPHLRDLFRRYVEARLESYRDVAGAAAARPAAAALQREIWSSAISAANASGEIPPYTVLLPALNAMFDIATTREEAKSLHPPGAVFIMLGVLALMGSLFAGYAEAGTPRGWIGKMGFPIVLAMALFVIIDFEFPRLGLIRIYTADSVLTEVRRSMN